MYFPPLGMMWYSGSKMESKQVLTSSPLKSFESQTNFGFTFLTPNQNILGQDFRSRFWINLFWPPEYQRWIRLSLRCDKMGGCYYQMRISNELAAQGRNARGWVLRLKTCFMSIFQKLYHKHLEWHNCKKWVRKKPFRRPNCIKWWLSVSLTWKRSINHLCHLSMYYSLSNIDIFLCSV